MNANRKLLVAATLSAIFSAESFAQLMLEEVIVTAQKREEGLQDTAISITAITNDVFDDLNISGSEDYEAVVPSLSVREDPSRLFLRGVGRVTNSLGTEPGVAFYIDQIYSGEITELTRSTSLTVERLEVLRGPQGTLFGRNAAGGAVNITSKRPTDDFQHHVRAKVGNYDLLNVGASSSGPITDSLRYRVHAYQNTRDGYVENINTGDDIYNVDNYGVGAQLDWDVSDTLNVWFSYRKDETESDSLGVNYGGFLITPYDTTSLTQDGFLLSESYQWDKENPAVRDPYKVDVSDISTAKRDGINKYYTHVTWDLEPVTVKYIGSYQEGDFTNLGGDLGYTSNPNNRVVENSGQNRELYSHELQFLSAGDGPLQWVAGLYYYQSETEQPYSMASIEAQYMDNVLPVGSFDPSLITPNPGRIQYWQVGDLDSESHAIYGDANYTFNESWKLTVGLRYTEDEKEGFEAQRVVYDPNISGFDLTQFFGPSCCGWLLTDEEVAQRTVKDDWNNTSGRVVLDWTPTDDTLIYASIATGYKSGGFRLGGLEEDPSFDPEELISYELGYKGTFNETLRVNAAAYFYDYQDMQVLIPALNAQNVPIPRIVNAEEAEVTGLELEATWLATENLMLMLNYSYIDGEYTDFCCFIDTIGAPELGPQDLSGTTLSQTPKNKIFANASYSWYTDSMGEWVLSASYSWVDERQYEVFDTGATRADSYYRADAQLSWFSPDDAWRVILSGRNLTDEFTWTSLERVNEAGALTGSPNAPRNYALEVQFNF